MTHEMPPIELDRLRPLTRDWLLTKSAKEGKSPIEVLIEILDKRAAAAGYAPTPEPRKAA